MELDDHANLQQTITRKRATEVQRQKREAAKAALQRLAHREPAPLAVYLQVLQKVLLLQADALCLALQIDRSLFMVKEFQVKRLVDPFWSILSP